jgi:hypothetical protein
MMSIHRKILCHDMVVFEVLEQSYLNLLQKKETCFGIDLNSTYLRIAEYGTRAIELQLLVTDNSKNLNH